MRHYSLHIESWKGSIKDPEPKSYRMDIIYVQGADRAFHRASTESDKLLKEGRRVCIIRRDSRGRGKWLDLPAGGGK